MRRLAPPVLALLLGLLLAGCSDSVPGGKTVLTPTPSKVVGKLPKAPVALEGNATAGKAVFLSSGCTGCHKFKPAGPAATGTTGPDLDNLVSYAKAANQGTLAQFVTTSIKDPDAYIAPGYSAGVMPSTYGTTLKPQQLADLVAFLVKGAESPGS